MDKKLKQGLGRVVRGELFWDREVEKQELIGRIEEGAHVLLIAQRRMGKTSLMAEVHDQLQEDFICLFVDVQAAKDTADFVTSLSEKCWGYTGLLSKVRAVFGNIVNNIEEVGVGDFRAKIRGGLNAGNWKAKGDQLFEILAKAERPVVLMLDEVPVMVNRLLKGQDFRITPDRRKEVDEFMSWLREKSIQHQGKIRLVISGSIGLEPVLRQAGLSATINNFVPMELKPWDENTVVGCVDALARESGLTLEEGVAQEMFRKLGCGIPHHVQLFFTHLHDYCKRRGKTACELKDVKAVYQGEMLGVKGHAELTHYEERLKLVLGEGVLALALEMLTEAAMTGCLISKAIEKFQADYEFEGEAVADVEKEILWVLQHDGYLQESPKGYVFVSKLLQNWWRSRYEKFYTPILKREG